MKRRHFVLGSLGLGALSACRASGRAPAEKEETVTEPAADLMPVVFVGHGAPTNALADNFITRGFAALGQDLPRPRAILAVSAHWWTVGLQLTGDAKPETIHDFGGFPRALYELQYPAPGAPDLARQIRGRLDGAKVSTDWGLDHGTWTVLRHMYPDADIPVLQLSIDKTRSPAQHLELGRALAELRGEGVLILGSGNVTHNLRVAFDQMKRGSDEVPEWSRDFDARAKTMTEQRDEKIASLHETELGRISHPSVDHWLPYLVAFGAARSPSPSRASTSACPCARPAGAELRAPR